MGGHAIHALPCAELARRAAGGDGGAFVRLYDRHSAEVFAAVLGASGSVDVASAATQTAFLTLLGHPPAMGAPDAEVVERLHALAIGAGVEGSPPTRPASAGSGSGWLRRETVLEAGAHFEEDWSVHLDEAPDSPRHERVAAALPLAPAVPPAEPGRDVPPPAPARRSPLAAVRDLPLRAAAVGAVLLAVLSFAAVIGLSSESSEPAADTAAAASDVRPSPARTEAARAPDRARRASQGKGARKRRGSAKESPRPAGGDRRPTEHSGDRGSGPHPVDAPTQRVAGRRQASAPSPPQQEGSGGGTVRERRTTTQTQPAPEPAPEPAPAPAPAPEQEDGGPGNNGRGHGYGRDKERPADGDG